MGRPQGWSTRFTGRKALRSPGTPGISNKRQRQREFWNAIAEGFSSEDAGTRVGVSGAVAARWFRDTGGMRPSTLAKTVSGRYLSFEEREEIALLRAKDLGVREIARHWDAQPQQYPENCGAMPPLVAGRSSIGPRLRSGTPNAAPGDPSLPSWRTTSDCMTTLGSDSRVRSPTEMVTL